MADNSPCYIKICILLVLTLCPKPALGLFMLHSSLYVRIKRNAMITRVLYSGGERGDISPLVQFPPPPIILDNFYVRMSIYMDKNSTVTDIYFFTLSLCFMPQMAARKAHHFVSLPYFKILLLEFQRVQQNCNN